MNGHYKRILTAALWAVLLTGCGSSTREPTQPPSTHPVESTAPAAETTPSPETTMPATEPPPTATVLEGEASGLATARTEGAVIDYSHPEDGYVMVCYTAQTESRFTAGC